MISSCLAAEFDTGTPRTTGDLLLSVWQMQCVQQHKKTRSPTIWQIEADKLVEHTEVDVEVMEAELEVGMVGIGGLRPGGTPVVV